MSDPEIRVREQPKPQDAEEVYELECLLHYQAALGGPAGDFVLRDLARQCLLDQSVFTQAHYDPVKAAFLEGRRSVVLRLLQYSGRKMFDL